MVKWMVRDSEKFDKCNRVYLDKEAFLKYYNVEWSYCINKED